MALSLVFGDFIASATFDEALSEDVQWTIDGRYRFDIDPYLEVDDYHRIMMAVLGLMEDVGFRVHISKLFGDVLYKPETVEKYGPAVKELSQSQLIRLLQTNRELMDASIEFLLATDRLMISKNLGDRKIYDFVEKEKRPKRTFSEDFIESFYDKWVKAKERIVADPHALEVMQDISDPIEPVKLVFKKRGKEPRPRTYTEIESYSTHDREARIDEYVTDKKLVEYLQSLRAGEIAYLNSKELMSEIVVSSAKEAKSRGVQIVSYQMPSSKGQKYAKGVADRIVRKVSEERPMLRRLPADDVARVWVNTVHSAKYQVVGNVFEMDLPELYEAIIKQANWGVEQYWGFDDYHMSKNRIRKTMVRAISRALGHNVAIDSAGLNHMKAVVIDADYPERATVLFASANPTNSGSHPNGDLRTLRPAPDADLSNVVPNANHVFVIKSYIIAQLFRAEIYKTVRLRLKGTSTIEGSFWRSGAWMGIGPLKKYQGPHKIVDAPTFMEGAFSPAGAIGNINNYFIARKMELTNGPAKMLQLSASSQEVLRGLRSLIRRNQEKGLTNSFRAVVDEAAAITDWSIFLQLTEYSRATSEELKQREIELETLIERLKTREITLESVMDFIHNQKKFVENMEGELRQSIGEENLDTLRKMIILSPEPYRVNYIKSIDGKKVQASAKIHHKVLILNAIITGSFNFSDGALENQEQILSIHDPEIRDFMLAVERHLFELGREYNTLKSRVEQSNARDREKLYRKLRTRLKDMGFSPEERKAAMALINQKIKEEKAVFTPPKEESGGSCRKAVGS